MVSLVMWCYFTTILSLHYLLICQCLDTLCTPNEKRRSTWVGSKIECHTYIDIWLINPHLAMVNLLAIDTLQKSYIDTSWKDSKRGVKTYTCVSCIMYLELMCHIQTNLCNDILWINNNVVFVAYFCVAYCLDTWWLGLSPWWRARICLTMTTQTT